MKGVFKIILVLGAFFCNLSCNQTKPETFATFTVNPNEANIEFFWKDESGEIFRSLENLKKSVEAKGKNLQFAMNGGMYLEDNQPLGLFIQNGKIVTPLNTKENLTGNFYLKPNGVFYLTAEKKAFLSPTQSFKNDGNVQFATQSSPMLLIDGNINSEFKKGSGNLNIRNGVCVLEDNKIVFAISRVEVNFYDFAEHFKNSGCRNALYLDGFVSRMYLPEQNIGQLDGDFGVIIGVTK
jgi:uncharacterized protein YigE (DUF2233 family)